MPLSKTFVNDCNEDISLFLPRRERFVTSSNQLDPLNCWNIYFALWTQTGTVTSRLSHYKGCKHVPPNFLKDYIWVTSTSFFIICGNDKMYKGQKQKRLPMLRSELFFHAKFTKKKLTWWTCHEVVNLNPALKNKVSFVCDDTCDTPGLGRGEYSSNIRVKESRWGFQTLTQFRTTKTLKIHTLFRTNAKMKAVLF